MKPFEYTAPTGTADALDALSAAARPLAGGTDLLPRMKLGLDRPERLVDLKSCDLPRRIEHLDGGWRIGALVTLADVQHHEELRRAHAGLAEAVEQAATPQIRNRATLAGNLVQRPRCWYFRNEAVDCWLTGGDTCPARTGRNEHHAVFDTGPCVAVHPSDAASVLVALDARVTVAGRAGERDLAVADLLVPATEDRRVEHVLADDALITAITVPDGPGLRSTYVKAMDRAVWAFALVGVAAAVAAAPDGTVSRARVVASGVAGTPWRLTAVEDALTGAPMSAERIDAAAARSTDGATPLSSNAYKLRLLHQLTRRALRRLAG